MTWIWRCAFQVRFFPRVPDCLVCLLSPTVNLWTMFQAAQKLGGYELVSAHMCGNIFLLLGPGLALLLLCLPPPDVYLPLLSSSLLSFLSLLFLFYFSAVFSPPAPWGKSQFFPRGKPHLERKKEMMPLFRNPLRVENTCSSAQPWSGGNWSTRSFFPMMEMKRNAHMFPQNAHLSMWETFELAAIPAVFHSPFMCDMFPKCSQCLMSCRKSRIAHACFFISQLI